MNKLGKVLDIYLHKYDHIFFIGHFKLEICERSMHDFCDVCSLEISNTSTCFKNLENPFSIDLLLTNSKSNFDETLILESVPPNFHELVVLL